MSNWRRRSVLSSGAGLSAAGILASLGAGELESDDPADSEMVLAEQTGWNSYGGTAGNTRCDSSTSTLEELETIKWQYEERGDPAVVNGTVYLRTGSDLHALDADDGSPRWTCPQIDAAGPPAVADDCVYVTGDQLTAVDSETGSVRWSEAFDTDVSMSAPVAAFDGVFVAANGILSAFDADGSLRWTCESVSIKSTDDSGASTYAFSSRTGALAVADGTVWALLDKRRNDVRSKSDAIAAFDPMTGTVQWSGYLESGTNANGLTATNETVFVENQEEEGVTVFNVESKTIRQHISDAHVAAVVDNRVVTQGSHSLKLTSPDASWEKAETFAYGTPAISGQTVVVAHSTNGSRTPDELVGFDLEGGDECWRFTFNESQWIDGFGVEVTVADETVYVNREEGLTAVCPADVQSTSETVADEDDC